MAENGAIVEMLRGIQTGIAGLRTDMTGLKHDMSGLRHDMTGLKHDMSGIKADIAGLKADFAGFKVETKAELRSHLDTLNVLAQDVRMIRATIHDMGETRPTEGELTSLHEDVNRFQHDLIDLKTRVGVLEGQRPIEPLALAFQALGAQQTTTPPRPPRRSPQV
jgi:hypothetical protein